MTKKIPDLRAKLLQLEALHRSGDLGADAYQRARAQLERRLVDQVMAAPEALPVVPAADRPSRGLGLGLAAGVLLLAVAGYLWSGSPEVLVGAPPPAEPPAHQSGDADFAAAVDKLAERLQQQPDDADGWATLGRSLSHLGRHAEALKAFEKAVALVPDDARLLADQADAMAVLNDRQLEGEPMRLVERALKIDPNQPKALALAGTAAFNRKDYAAAVRLWETLKRTAPADSPLLPTLQDSIAEARRLGGMAAAPVAAASAAATAGPATGAAAGPAAGPAASPFAAPAGPASAAPSALAGAGIQGRVRLSPALAKLASPEDTVFVFARPAEGSRMPLAIVRKQVKDLPFDFKLDDSMAMSPAAKLSLFPSVVVGARISKTGQAVPSAGDLSGLSGPVANTSGQLQIEINEVMKP